tara:strand:- start:3092 stop:3364 length:273 start_codon:yes stop_codon:yes gene_type:complete
MIFIYKVTKYLDIFFMKNSEKRDKFIKLAEGRTQNALNEIRKIGNLSNRRAYDYTNNDTKKIIKALRDAVSEVEKRFSSTDDSSDKFKLL